MFLAHSDQGKIRREMYLRDKEVFNLAALETPLKGLRFSQDEWQSIQVRRGKRSHQAFLDALWGVGWKSQEGSGKSTFCSVNS